MFYPFKPDTELQMTTAPTYEGCLTKIINVTHTGVSVNYPEATDSASRERVNLDYLQTQLQETLEMLRERAERFKKELTGGQVFALVNIQLKPVYYSGINRQVIMGTGTILYSDTSAITFIGAPQLASEFHGNTDILALLEEFDANSPDNRS